MKWLEISVRVRREDIDLVSDIFDRIGTGGVVIEDPALIYDYVLKGNSETVAMEAPGDPDSPPVVKGWLPVDGRLPGKLEEFRGALGAVDPEYPGRVSFGEADESDWMIRWKEFYRPVRVGRSILVRPSWEKVDQPDGLLVVEMDPGMAFGCGTHPTTAMCMEIIEEVVRGGETVLDVGTGSGILSITAARLGAAAVLAVDSDPVAVRVAGENISANGLADIVRVQEGNLLDGVEMKADLIMANIVADVIIRLLPAAVPLLNKGGKIIASGVIEGRRDEVAAAITGHGLEIVKAVSQGEWTAFLARKH